MSVQLDEGLAGVDPVGVARWLQARTAATLPVSFEIIVGGRSNLTYVLTDDDGRRWVLRRPPLHSVLASAHDVGREYRIMAALQATAVPVPPLVGLEADETVIGTPFYVMEYVDGVVPRDAAKVVDALDAAARAAVGINLADTLADLHAVDVDAVGLGGLAKRSDYIARQLHRWSRQYTTGSQRDLPLVMDVHDRLAAAIPSQAAAAIVHGDYRLDNVIVASNGAIKAVLDWELCTLGDPLADLGLLTVYWAPPAGRPMPMIPAAGTIPDVVSIETVIARYAERSGRDVAELDYYVAFGYWKLALILEGVSTRFSAGAYGASDGTHDEFGSLVIELLELAAEMIPSQLSRG